MFSLARFFQLPDVVPYRETLRQAREAAQKAHNDALRAGDTRRQYVTRKRLVEATNACLKAGV